MSIDNTINDAVAPISEALFNFVFTAIPVGGGQEAPLVLIWLFAAGVFFTFYLNFTNLRDLPLAFRIIKGDFDKGRGEMPGQITRFQALATTLSGTVGIGNIAGVAMAIAIGGPGAMVWMIMTGLVGMSSKFAECTLAVKYRRTFDDGHVSGGPMYYLRDGLRAMGLSRLGLVLGSIFAFCCIFGAIGAGNMFQANQAYAQLVEVTGGGEISWFSDKGWVVGIALGLLVGAVIMGGIKSIARVTSRIVPFMGVVYILAGLVVISMNLNAIPEALTEIFTAAFTLKAGMGGLIGAIIMGVQRGAFSNEAGFGSGAIPHAAVKTDTPVTQGYVAMLGPFIDTVVICTVTALVIVVSGVYTDETGMGGVALTSKAFEASVSWFPYVLSLAVFLFAFSTMISWFYYGLKSVMFLFNESSAAAFTFKVIYCFSTVLGTTANLGAIIMFTDAALFLMSVPNIIGLYLMAKIIKSDQKSFLQSIGNK